MDKKIKRMEKESKDSLFTHIHNYCETCKKDISGVVGCSQYDRKPNPVLLGKKCEYYEKDLEKISKQKQQIVQETGYKTAVRKDI